ncbi:hypothetical protein [Massilia yuzhufengensis]|uniref:Peptidase MA superfamily protein n=1 Tax=Massilia yuzhufengensis TaxID=1164594 RepID=A0A1I1NTD2_9BURK|nr:hypothetical protein [Massilia yuzhufengensis]SFD00666.1 hypothetical protein SAMN05216204_11424 [Massilia yuzhufengensis]
MKTRTRTSALRFLKAGVASLLAVALLYALIVAIPKPMFPYRAVYQNYQVWSDQPIPAEIAGVLDDVTRRLRTSTVHDRTTPVEIFFCNEPWRLWLYGRRFSTRMGGAADVWLTRQVFIRASDIAANRIHSPGPGPIADAAQRPLSYFIAHEITHSDVSRRFGRTVMLRYPEWLLEGYADYVGKGGDFDFDENRALFLRGAWELGRKSGLYRGYHLKVAYLLDKEGWTLQEVFARPPGEGELDAWLRAGR